jgi:uncharacterized protein YqjF (DUF2071 family)
MPPTRTSRALFVADWTDAIFVHFAVDARKMQPLVPLELDCFDRVAYVSLVAFTQRNLRPSIGGRISQWLAMPLAQHEFLNVRTYVRHGDTRGIFFLAEWIPNRLAAFIGPRTYGLPYRLGTLDYTEFHRSVSAGRHRLSFDVRREGHQRRTCAPGSLDHFLLERYSAFTCRNGITRQFDVAHAPWPITRAGADVIDATLLRSSGDWLDSAELACVHCSPGVRDVTISAPRRVTRYFFGGGGSPTASPMMLQ